MLDRFDILQRVFDCKLAGNASHIETIGRTMSAPWFERVKIGIAGIDESVVRERATIDLEHQVDLIEGELDAISSSSCD